VLYKHKRLLEQLRVSGRAAQAKILHCRDEGTGATSKRTVDFDITQSWGNYQLELRVRPEGEPEFDAVVKTRLYWGRNPGDVVEVFYDPDDHDRIVVDHEAEGRKDMEQMKRLQSMPDRIAAST
jgi:hypothetical protein